MRALPIVITVLALASTVYSTEQGKPSPPPKSPTPPCAPTGAYRGSRFCNESLPLEARVADFLDHIDIQEKFGQLGTTPAYALPSVDLPSFEWWNEGLHGVAGSPGVKYGGKFKYTTSFPQVCLTASSWNRTLWTIVGQTTSTEARSMYNGGRAGLTYWTPNLNIFRDPRWGRGQETPGEDPFLTGEYVAVYVPGLQSPQNGKLKISACCKHFDAYSLENWHGVTRHSFNAKVTPRDLKETYQPAFQSCVQRGKASGIMCSYNAVNGVPSCANGPFMNGLARGKWGFNGYITSDCGAVHDVEKNHHYTKTPAETVKVTLEAGMDINCGVFLQNHTEAAYRAGIVTEKHIQTALTHQFNVRFRLGMFDLNKTIPWAKLGPENVNTPEHQALALEAAHQGIVLLQNNKKTLPLSTESSLKIALVGPNANATKVMLGNYYGSAPYKISPLDAFHAAGRKVMYAQGCNVTNWNHYENFTLIPEAVAAAKSADVVVMVIGLDQTVEREGLDRVNLTFPGVQPEFIAAVTKAAGSKPLVAVVMSGGPVDMTLLKTQVDSILWTGYPGQSGGQAIYDVLFNKVNPSGRLIHTQYKADYVNQISMFDMNMPPTNGTPGRTYRYFTEEAVFPFGWGLSYSNFTEKWTASREEGVNSHTIAQHLRKYEHHPHEAPVIAKSTATVTNHGPYDGDYVVQMFVVGPNPGKDGNPLKSLQGFDKVAVKVGETKVVNFGLTAFQIASNFDSEGNRKALPGTWELVGSVGTENTAVKVHFN